MDSKYMKTDGSELPPELHGKMENIISEMRRGDSSCRWKIGTRIKILRNNPDGVYKKGDKGTIIGCKHIFMHDGYLIHLDKDEEKILNVVTELDIERIKFLGIF